MPDWQKLVRKGLSGLKLGAAEKEEVHAELAAHLEETYEALLKEGVPAREAIHHVVSFAGNWNDLQRKIHAARNRKDPMTNRVKQFWLPSLLTLLLSMGLLILVERFGRRPWVIAPEHRSGWSLIAPAAVVYLPWLFLLPLIGAMGAYLSNRAGGSQRAAFSSIVFPVLPYLVTFLIGLPMIVLLNPHIVQTNLFNALFIGLFAWVLAPAAALLVGGLLAKFFISRRLDPRRIVSG